MHPLARATRLAAVGLALVLPASPLLGGATVPTGFVQELVEGGFDRPCALAFAPDGRLFVAEQRGVVWVIDPDGDTLPAPFIDLQDEVGNAWDRGMLGIALDPDFLDNRRVYLLYTVDPVFGRPDEPGETATFSRLTRYEGSAASGGNVADLASRSVLIGATPAEGIPTCYASHTIGCLRFGHDGSLLIASGDSASFGWADVGGTTPGCFEPGLFGPDEDIGAYRAQSLESMGGKILRVDPESGGGPPDNPFFDGDPFSDTSRIWATGLRNPFRMALRPGSPGVGTLYIGDVGWFTMEEINVARGGENFGWPCHEGVGAAPEYPNEEVPFYGCDTIETPVNPGPLTPPLVQWHHGNGGLSIPTGPVGFCSVGGVFYDGARYPPLYHGAFFYADHVFSWVRILKTTPEDQLQQVRLFATFTNNPVDFAVNPLTGDVHYAAIGGQVRRFRYIGADLNDDGAVDGSDLGILLANWGSVTFAPGDLDGNHLIDGGDLGVLLANWG